jgi:hypothetical protein
MKHLRILGVLLAAAFALSAFGASTASARCAHALNPTKGRWDNGLCTVEGGLKLYVKVKPGGTFVGHIECAEVETGEPAQYSDPNCTEEGANKKFALVLREAVWHVGGAALTTAAALATTAKVDSAPKLSIVTTGGTVQIQCKGTVLKGAKPEIMVVDEGLAESLTFEGCETISPTKCALAGQPTSIKTNPLRAFAKTLTKSIDRIAFLPATKKTFAEIPFSETNTCALNETEPINGSVTVGAPTGQEERVEQAIEGLGSVENNSLETAGNKAFLEGGSILLKLASGSKWSFS